MSWWRGQVAVKDEAATPVPDLAGDISGLWLSGREGVVTITLNVGDAAGGCSLGGSVVLPPPTFN